MKKNFDVKYIHYIHGDITELIISLVNQDRLKFRMQSRGNIHEKIYWRGVNFYYPSFYIRSEEYINRAVKLIERGKNV